MKNLAKFSVVLVLMALTVGTLKAQDNLSYQTNKTEIFDLNEIIVDCELYLWNRISDVFDILRCGVAVGPGIGAEVAITDYVTLGAYANAEKGVSFPHFVFPLWIIDYYAKKEPFMLYHSGRYATAAFGPWRREYNPISDSPYRFERNRWDVRAQLDALLIHVYVAINPLEIYDLIAGLAGIDPSGDDSRADKEITRMPADQLGRGLCNLAFGALEIPKTIFAVNDSEGDLPAVTKGVFLGIWRCVVREIVGLVEFVAFPFGWQPIIEPVYVVSEDQNDVWHINKPSFHKSTDTTNTWGNQH